MPATVGITNRRDVRIQWVKATGRTPAILCSMEASKNRDVNNSNYASKVPATTAIATTIHARQQ